MAQDVKNTTPTLQDFLKESQTTLASPAPLAPNEIFSLYVHLRKYDFYDRILRTDEAQTQLRSLLDLALTGEDTAPLQAYLKNIIDTPITTNVEGGAKFVSEEIVDQAKRWSEQDAENTLAAVITTHLADKRTGKKKMGSREFSHLLVNNLVLQFREQIKAEDIAAVTAALAKEIEEKNLLQSPLLETEAMHLLQEKKKQLLQHGESDVQKNQSVEIFSTTPKEKEQTDFDETVWIAAKTATQAYRTEDYYERLDEDQKALFAQAQKENTQKASAYLSDLTPENATIAQVQTLAFTDRVLAVEPKDFSTTTLERVNRDVNHAVVLTETYTSIIDPEVQKEIAYVPDIVSPLGLGKNQTVDAIERAYREAGTFLTNEQNIIDAFGKNIAAHIQPNAAGISPDQQKAGGATLLNVGSKVIGEVTGSIFTPTPTEEDHLAFIRAAEAGAFHGKDTEAQQKLHKLGIHPPQNAREAVDVIQKTLKANKTVKTDTHSQADRTTEQNFVMVWYISHVAIQNPAYFTRSSLPTGGVFKSVLQFAANKTFDKAFSAGTKALASVASAAIGGPVGAAAGATSAIASVGKSLKNVLNLGSRLFEGKAPKDWMSWAILIAIASIFLVLILFASLFGQDGKFFENYGTGGGGGDIVVSCETINAEPAMSIAVFGSGDKQKMTTPLCEELQKQGHSVGTHCTGGANDSPECIIKPCVPSATEECKIPLICPGVCITQRSANHSTDSHAAVIDGPMKHPAENAVDLACGRGRKDPVIAYHKGLVVLAQWYGAYGNTIIIEDEGHGYRTLYSHLDHFVVRKGDTVTKGQPIGVSDNTGNSTGSHLHFERLDAKNGFISGMVGPDVESLLPQMKYCGG